MQTWGTPAYIADIARDIMGTIDLDPASSAWHNLRIRAGLYYDKDMDGTGSRVWGGNVFCNPPYGRGLLLPFTLKWRNHAHQISQSFWVMNAVTDTKAGQMAMELSDLVHFPSSRICFINPETGKPGESPMLPQMILWSGDSSRQEHARQHLKRIDGLTFKST